jgi:hypothetical protein
VRSTATAVGGAALVVTAFLLDAAVAAMQQPSVPA